MLLSVFFTFCLLWNSPITNFVSPQSLLVMTIDTNSAISVDCAVFGFDGTSLKVLLIKRRYPVDNLSADDLKLPGAMIQENETLQDAASRVLEDSTGLRNIYLRQTSIFSDPSRVSRKELDWICKYHGINTNRVVTVGYYALVKLNQNIISYTRRKGAKWVEVDLVRHLIMDHMDILGDALNILQREFTHTPIAFELLPKRFTIRQLQALFNAVLGVNIDNRNFRKKILSSGLLTATGEQEVNVAHKPAQFYTFNRSAYKKAMKDKFKLYFLDNWSY